MASFQSPITQFAPIVGGANKSLTSSGIGTAGQVYTSNGPGVAPSFQASAGAQVVKYVSDVVNFKVTGLYNLFTTASSGNFIPLNLTMVCDSAVSEVGDNMFNVGWTAASYNDWSSGLAFQISAAGNFIAGATPGTSLEIPYAPISTAIKVNVTNADSGTTLTGRIIITGIYI